MKALLRAIVFTFLAVELVQSYLSPFIFGEPYKAYLLFMFAVVILNLYLRSILKMVSLPAGGFLYLLINFILTVIILQVLTLFVPSFYIVPINFSNLIIFGFVLPSNSLSAFWSGVLSAFVISLVSSFFDWLCIKPKK